MGAGLSSNAYNVEGSGSLSALDISGTVDAANIFVSYQFVRSRASNVFGKLDLMHKRAETVALGKTVEDLLTALVFEVGFDELDKKYKGINQGSVKYTQGFEDFLGSSAADDLVSPSRTGATSDYAKLNWSVARLQLINKHQNILLRFSGQYSDDLLFPVEQAGLGGPNNVRAFEPSVVLRDSSVFLSMDWNFNAPFFYEAKAFDGWKWGEILQLSVFADYARGVVNEPTLSDVETINISGYGVAAQLLLPGKMQLRLDIAKPVNSLEISGPAALSGAKVEEDVQFYLTFSYTG
jgi:hemolysin activation/secretion protein